MKKDRGIQPEDIRQLMVETAKVQVASLDAGIAFWTGWVERTSAFAKSANAELLALTKENQMLIGPLTAWWIQAANTCGK